MEAVREWSLMDCPLCQEPIGNVIEHVKKCSVDHQRLMNVGLMSLEEYNIINNIEGVAETTPPTKQ